VGLLDVCGVCSHPEGTRLTGYQAIAAERSGAS
jgi:hypothetical protein